MELFARLMDELDVTREQAEGGAGSLLQFAQARFAERRGRRLGPAAVKTERWPLGQGQWPREAL